MLAKDLCRVFTVDMAINSSDLPRDAEFRFSPEVAAAMSADSMRIEDMVIGQVVRLSMLEGAHNERFVSLDLSYDSPPADGCVPGLSVIDGVVPEETVAINERFNVKFPRMVGGTMLIQGGCTKYPKQLPTMVHVGHIDKQRDLWSTFETEDGGGMLWFPLVVDFELLTVTPD